jgi:uncharacterized protein YbjT (DUF2867 family)
MIAVLVAGGTGMIGKLVVKELIATGQYEVYILSRGHEKV